MEAELVALREENQSRINELEQRLAALNNDKSNALNQVTESQLTGLASRIEALDRLTKKSNAIKVAHWFILLLIVQEVLVKMISTLVAESIVNLCH